MSLRDSSTVKRLMVAVCAGLALAQTMHADGGGGVAAAECAFDPSTRVSPRELWHRLSQNAEAYSAAGTSGRRRAVAPRTNFIDDETFGKMRRDGVPWTTLAGDEEFLRRVTVDLTGQIPTAAEVRQFIADTAANKRERVIDRLLQSEPFAERWTLWLGDHLQNVQTSTNVYVGAPGRNAYYTLIRDAIRSDRPYDELVRELLTASGPQNSVGAANYWVRQIQTNGPVQDTWDNLAAHSAEKFLGLPLNCISCHDGMGHLEALNLGLARRRRADFWQMAAFFATHVQEPMRLPSGRVEWEILPDPTARGYLLNTTSGNKTPRIPARGAPESVRPAFFMTGEQPHPGESPREAYARMLTAHPQFARATVNYIWKELFGLGIVEPPDSFDLLRQDLQVTHPELLAKLADSFRTSGFSLRSLLRTMVTSATYQLSTHYAPGGWREEWAPYHARHLPRRMLAESIVDAISRATRAPLPRMFVTGGVVVERAVALPDPTEPRSDFTDFLNSFGRGDRDTAPRVREGSILQAFRMFNDSFVTTRVRSDGETNVAAILATTRDPGTIVDELYLATLSRRPTAEERAAGVSYLSTGDPARKTEDLQLVLLNCLEFLFN